MFLNLGEPAPIVRLADRGPDGDRWYRVLVDNQVGSAQATQFVVRFSRAPDHFITTRKCFHPAGQRLHGRVNARRSPPVCVYLPKGQVHCVENSGPGELRVLGVFYPAGASYDVD